MQYPIWMTADDIAEFEKEYNALLDKKYDEDMMDLDAYADEVHDSVMNAQYDDWMEEEEYLLDQQEWMTVLDNREPDYYYP